MQGVVKKKLKKTVNARSARSNKRHGINIQKREKTRKTQRSSREKTSTDKSPPARGRKKHLPPMIRAAHRIGQEPVTANKKEQDHPRHKRTCAGDQVENKQETKYGDHKGGSSISPRT